MFKDYDEDNSIYKTNQQYQSFSNKTLLPLDEYLENIRPGLIKLMIKNYEVELNVNLVFRSKNNPNDECSVFITTKSADIDEVFDHLIKKQEDLKDINFLLKDVESIAHSLQRSS